MRLPRLYLSGQLLSVIVITLSALSASPRRYEVLPSEYDGTMTPYDFSMVEPCPELPDSLRPFFINYIGRHGARYLSSEKKVSAVERALEKARRHGGLTRKGRDFLKLVAEVREATAGRWGALDSIGAAEQRRLASEMSAMWPEITGSGLVRARATYVPRVVMSMYEFCHRLAALNPSLEVYTGEGHQYDALLRYFVINSAYATYLESGSWKGVYDRYLEEHAPAGPAVRLVGAAGGLDGRSLRRLSMDIYGILQSLRAAGLPAPTTEWMSVEEYRACWEVGNLRHYLQRVANRESDLPAMAARPLLHEMIAAADSAAAAYDHGDSSGRANLLFGHAETVMPLFSAMGLPGCAPCYENCYRSLSVSSDYSDLPLLWNDTKVSPLGANLQMVLLRGESGAVYVLLRLNGRNIPPREGMPLINRWQDVKRIWIAGS